MADGSASVYSGFIPRFMLGKLSQLYYYAYKNTPMYLTQVYQTYEGIKKYG